MITGLLFASLVWARSPVATHSEERDLIMLPGMAYASCRADCTGIVGLCGPTAAQSERPAIPVPD